MSGMKAKAFGPIIALLSIVMMIGCAQTPIVSTATPNPTEPSTATAQPTPGATSTRIPRPTETIPAPPTPLPTPLFTGNCVSPGSIFAYSPVGNQWLIGVSLELWGIEPDGSTELFARYTPFDPYYWPLVKPSPDGTMLAFGAETGGALYYPYTGRFLRFRGVDFAHNDPSSIGYFAWSADSQSLYYNVCCQQPGSSQIWRIHINNPDKPQLLAEGLHLSASDYGLFPAVGLPDGRLLMEYYPGQRANAALWDSATNRVIALTHQGDPIHVWDTQSMQAVSDTGPQTPLLIGRFGDQAEMIGVVEVQPPNVQPWYSQAAFLPDGRIAAVWEDQSTVPPTSKIVLFTSGDTGYSMTVLSSDTSADAEIAVYGDRLIVEDTIDTTTGRTVLLQMPLDGSPPIHLAEGMFQIVTPWGASGNVVTWGAAP